MEILELLGYLGALLIGLVLGLIGGGGSILTVPILVYMLSLNPLTATAYSLFVVGATSLVGAIKNMTNHLENSIDKTRVGGTVFGFYGRNCLPTNNLKADYLEFC